MADVTSASTRAGGLGTAPARWVLVFVWACGVLWSLAQGSFASPEPIKVIAGGFGYAAGLVGALILTTPGGALLRRPRVGCVLVLALSLAVVTLSHAPTGAEIWGLDFATYLMALLIVRGHTVAGALGSAATIGYALAWAVAHGAPPDTWPKLLGIPIGSVAAAFAWRLVLVHIVRRERAHRGTAARAEQQAKADADAIVDAQRQLADIRAEVAELLTRIARGDDVDAALRTDLTRAEASVRDRISVPHLRHPLLIAEFARLRNIGVTVVVLGEVSPAGGIVGTALAKRVVQITADVTRGRVTVRGLPDGRSAALSVVRPSTTGSEQIMLSADGRVLSRT